MPIGDGDLILWAVLVAPGFIAVMTAVRLAALEHEIPSFVLLVWSLVVSMFINAMFLWAYQLVHGGVSSFAEVDGILFEPYFRVDYIMYIFGFSLFLGMLGAAGIIVDAPGRARGVLQAKSRVKYSPRQPWGNFMDDTVSLRIKASDENFFVGTVVEWSRAGRPKEVRIKDPHWFNPEKGEYEMVGKTGNEEMLFLEKDIDRLMLRTHDVRPSWWMRLKARWLKSDEDETGGDDIESDEVKDRKDTDQSPEVV